MNALIIIFLVIWILILVILLGLLIYMLITKKKIIDFKNKKLNKNKTINNNLSTLYFEIFFIISPYYYLTLILQIIQLVFAK